MDTKRKNSKKEIAKATLTISKTAKAFKPNLIFLGDDNAAKYIGNHFLNYDIPIVFWGVNNTPVKYGLVESAEKPGHNVTGVYQPGYYVESLKLLKIIVPGVKTFAILSDTTTTGRSHQKKLEFLAHKGALPVKLAETVRTSEFEVWKSRALELQEKVDAFFVVHYSGLKDKDGKHVPELDVARWYLNHIKIPETSLGTRIKHGMLCCVSDSGYKQGYEAVVIAHDILDRGANPATYPPRAPKRGPSTVNKQRAKMLGITLTEEMGIEEYIEKASALQNAK